jgi:hypothetical protein
MTEQTISPQRAVGDVHLVGSLPFADAESAFHSAASGLGGRAAGLPDGEPGERKFWVNYLPQFIFSNHPDLTPIHIPDAGGPEAQPDKEPDGVRPGAAQAYWWTFKINDDVDELVLDLGYGRYALESWETFKRLRDEGTIPAGTRFQVSLPATVSAIDGFFESADDRERARRAYEKAIAKNVQEILAVVPGDDILFQIDFCLEVIDLAVGDETWYPFWEDHTYAEKLNRHLTELTRLEDVFPEEAPLGIHLCFGTWGGWPMVDMTDLSLCVELSNKAVAMAHRHLDFIHMPVDVTSEDAFYAPLANLDVGTTKIYLGLVHFHEETNDAFSARVATAQKYLSDFGVAAVCGYGRANPDEAGDIFKMHVECAELLHQHQHQHQR